MLVPGFEDHVPSSPPNEPSVFNDPFSGGWSVLRFFWFAFFFFSLLVMKFFNIVPGGFMLQILSAGFSFYWPFF